MKPDFCQYPQNLLSPTVLCGSPTMGPHITTSPFRISPIPVIHNQTPERLRIIHFQQNSQPTLPIVRKESAQTVQKSSGASFLQHQTNYQDMYNKLKEQHTQLQTEHDNLRQRTKNFAQQALDVQIAVLRMETEKCKFEIQSRDRQIQQAIYGIFFFSLSFLEERLRGEEEERHRLNSMYSKRLEQENQLKQELQELRDINQHLEQRVKNIQKDTFSKFIEENDDLRMRLSRQSQQLEEKDNLISVLSRNEDIVLIDKLKKDIQQLTNQKDQIEKIYLDKINQLCEENEQNLQGQISFEEQKLYFTDQMRECKEYYSALIEENEKLKYQIQLINEEHNEQIMEIQKLREQILLLRSNSNDENNMFFVQENQTSLTQAEIQILGDQYLSGQVTELDIQSLRELKKYLKHFRSRFIEIVKELNNLKSQKGLDPRVQNDINEIKKFMISPIATFPSNRSSEQYKVIENPQDRLVNDTLRELQHQNELILDAIERKKQNMQEQRMKRKSSTDSLSQQADENQSDDSITQNEINGLYQKYDENRHRINQLINQVPNQQKEDNDFRKKSSVSFDQSFEVQQFEF